MKKSSFIIAAIVLLVYGSHAQSETARIKKDEKSLVKQEKILRKEKKSERKEIRKLEGDEVSSLSRDHFYRDFGNVPGVTWRRDMYFDIATFTQNGMAESAYYNNDAELVGTTTEKKISDLPAKAQAYINKRYSDYEPEMVVLFDDNEHNNSDMFLFGRQFEDADNYFVVLKKNDKKIVLQSTTDGMVYYFEQLK